MIEAARISRRGVVLVSVIGAVATVTAAFIGYLATRSDVPGEPVSGPPPGVTASRDAGPTEQGEPADQDAPTEQDPPAAPGDEDRLELRLSLGQGVDVDAGQGQARGADGATGSIDVFLGAPSGFSQLTVSGDGMYVTKATDVPGTATEARTRCSSVVSGPAPAPAGVVPVAGVASCFVTSEGRVAWLMIEDAAADGSSVVLDVRAWVD